MVYTGSRPASEIRLCSEHIRRYEASLDIPTFDRLAGDIMRNGIKPVIVYQEGDDALSTVLLYRDAERLATLNLLHSLDRDHPVPTDHDDMPIFQIVVVDFDSSDRPADLRAAIEKRVADFDRLIPELFAAHAAGLN